MSVARPVVANTASGHLLFAYNKLMLSARRFWVTWPLVVVGAAFMVCATSAAAEAKTTESKTHQASHGKKKTGKEEQRKQARRDDKQRSGGDERPPKPGQDIANNLSDALKNAASGGPLAILKICGLILVLGLLFRYFFWDDD